MRRDSPLVGGEYEHAFTFCQVARPTTGERVSGKRFVVVRPKRRTNGSLNPDPLHSDSKGFQDRNR